MKVLILGVNGFIGNALTERILTTTDWQVYGLDMSSDKIEPFLADRRFQFLEGDISINKEWIEYHIKKCDVVLPLVAIATPIDVRRASRSRVFELDFEENLRIVQAVRAVQEARDFSVDVRGLRNVPRRGVRRGEARISCTGRSTSSAGSTRAASSCSTA